MKQLYFYSVGFVFNIRQNPLVSPPSENMKTGVKLLKTSYILQFKLYPTQMQVGSFSIATDTKYK